MIDTVTFNPSLDYIVTVNDFKQGAVNRTVEEHILPGGKGINVSRVLKNLGCESTALGFAAGFTGQELIRLLAETGIAADFIQVEHGMSRINVKLRNRNGAMQEESEINGQGPQPSPQDIRRLYDRLDRLSQGDILVMAGSIPDSLPKSMYRDIMEHLREKKLNIVVDATGALLSNVLSCRPFLIKPNNHELGELFGVPISDKDVALHYARRLQEQGARNVLVSMAGEGAVIASEDGGHYRMEAPKGRVVNSVGAGDSMVAGFLYGYMTTGDYREAFRCGVCTGSASAFSEELATKAEVLKLMERCTGGRDMEVRNED